MNCPPQGVEVEVPPSVVLVGDAGGVEVKPDHLRAGLGPRPRPQRLSLRPAGDVLPHQLRHISAEGLHVLAAVLRVAGQDRHGRRLAVESEGGRRQTAQLGGAKSRVRGEGVDPQPVRACQTAERLAVAGRLDEQVEALFTESSPGVANVHVGILPGQVRQRVNAAAAILHEPLRERSD